MATKDVRDPKTNKLVGSIVSSGSYLVARDARGREVAKYDQKSGYTTAKNGRTNGDHLQTHIWAAAREHEDAERRKAEQKAAADSERKQKEKLAADAKVAERDRLRQEALKREQAKRDEDQRRQAARDQQRKLDKATADAASREQTLLRKAAAETAALERRLAAERRTAQALRDQQARAALSAPAPRASSARADDDEEPPKAPRQRTTSRHRALRPARASHTGVSPSSETETPPGSSGSSVKLGGLVIGLAVLAALAWFAFGTARHADVTVERRPPSGGVETPSRQAPGAPGAQAAPAGNAPEAVPSASDASDGRGATESVAVVTVYHRHGRADFPDAAEPGSVPPQGFCRGSLTIAGATVTFVTGDSSDDRRDNLRLPVERIRKLERPQPGHLHMATDGRGDWDFFADTAVLDTAASALLARTSPDAH